jgi:hypothetical protein
MTLYDPDEIRRQLRRDRAIEAIAAAFGLVGAWLLATKGEHAAWGWWAFLGSNAGWLAFAWIRRHWFLLLQQVGFTGSSLWGIWNWMVAP